MTIGEKIVELRKKYHLTQEKLAEKVGVSRQTLANWESDLTSPNLNQASTLSQIFKVSLDELANNQLDILCQENDDNTIFAELLGKQCYLCIDDDYFDFYLDSDTLVTVLSINDDFIKIAYQKGEETCVKLLDLNLVDSIKVVKEENA